MNNKKKLKKSLFRNKIIICNMMLSVALIIGANNPVFGIENTREIGENSDTKRNTWMKNVLVEFKNILEEDHKLCDHEKLLNYPNKLGDRESGFGAYKRSTPVYKASNLIRAHIGHKITTAEKELAYKLANLFYPQYMDPEYPELHNIDRMQWNLKIIKENIDTAIEDIDRSGSVFIQGILNGTIESTVPTEWWIKKLNEKWSKEQQ